MKKFSLLLLAQWLSTALLAQTPHTHLPDRSIDFPDVPGYLTLTADLHQHTVFSDGEVWPTIRVAEALRDSLDVIAVTEHLEYLPHRDDIPLPDHNRAYHIEKERAEKTGLLVIPGSEITRSMPPGHANAIFITDANKIKTDKVMNAFKEAHAQGAFVFWNHPNWTAQKRDGIASLTKMHRKLIEKGYMQGIEVVNDKTYSEEALQIALDNNLTIIGTSDIHGLIDWEYQVARGGHRPVTLIFAKEKSLEAVKEALFARRTAVWFNNTLIGREEMLLPLLKASISIERTNWLEDFRGTTEVAEVVLRNDSDAAFLLYNKSPLTFHAHDDVVMLEPHSLTTILVKPGSGVNAFTLAFTVLNAVTAPNTHPDISWQVQL